MMNSNKRLLFDTHAFLAFFNKEKGSETIKNLMDSVQNGEAEGFVATISLTELAYIYSHRADKASAKLRVMQILHSPLKTVSLTAELAVHAGILKQPGIPVADAIIAASARSVHASVVTNDPHFSELDVTVIQYP